MLRRRKQRLAVITWFGGLALIVQAMLPLFLAIEFRLATIDAPYLTATDDLTITDGAICGAGHGGAPASDHGHHHMAACPICLTLAAAQAVTTPAEIVLTAPGIVGSIAGDHRSEPWPAAAADHAYEARAPPLNS